MTNTKTYNPTFGAIEIRVKRGQFTDRKCFPEGKEGAQAWKEYRDLIDCMRLALSDWYVAINSKADAAEKADATEKAISRFYAHFRIYCKEVLGKRMVLSRVDAEARFMHLTARQKNVTYADKATTANYNKVVKPAMEAYYSARYAGVTGEKLEKLRLAYETAMKEHRAAMPKKSVTADISLTTFLKGFETALVDAYSAGALKSAEQAEAEKKAAANKKKASLKKIEKKAKK